MTSGRRIDELGEFGLLARLRERVGSSYLGDDAAVLPVTPGRHLLATVDAQIDGVHFLRDRMTARQIGRRALAVNVSDIAAMGGEPRFALISLVLPLGVEVDWIDGLYDGLREEAARWTVVIAGGNLSRGPGPLVIDVTVLGEVDEHYVMTRSGARPGDLLFVTGDLGRAAAGLELLRRGIEDPLVEAYRTPTPRVREGRLVAATGQVHAAMDLSDGLASDLHRIAEQSGVGALLDAAALPISPAVRAAAGRCGLDPVRLALSGGEDFELLLAAPAGAVDALTAALAETDAPLTAIGAVQPAADGVRVRDLDGVVRPLAGGWNHFAGDHGRSER